MRDYPLDPNSSDPSSGACSLAALTEHLTRVLTAGAARSVRSSTDEELMEVGRSLGRCRSLFDAIEGHVAAELETRGATVVETGARTSSFLADAAGRSKAEYRRRVSNAMSLRAHFDTLDRAVIEGRISSAHAEAVLTVSNPRIHSQLIDLQEELIDLAETTGFARWKRHLLELAALLDQDGGYDPTADPCANKLTIKETGDGITLKGQLFGEAAEVTNSVLSKLADEIHRKYANDRRQADPDGDDHNANQHRSARPRRDALNALALVEACRRAIGRSIESNLAPRTQTDLVIHADIDGTQQAYSSDGGRLAQAVAETLRCDEAIRSIVMDRNGVPIHVGREQRLATPAQRAAIKARDGGCIFPGCDTPISWTVIHHVVPWSQGGTTDMDNLACLCHHHHGVTHSSDWTMKHSGDQHYEWTTPTRRKIISERKPHPGS